MAGVRRREIDEEVMMTVTVHTLKLTEPGEVEKVVAEALKELPVTDPKWVQEQVRDLKQAWQRHQQVQGSFRDMLTRIMECCARDQEKYLAHPHHEGNFYFRLCHHWITDPYDSAWWRGDNRLSFVCGLGGHNVWRSAVDHYVAIFHEL